MQIPDIKLLFENRKQFYQGTSARILCGNNIHLKRLGITRRNLVTLDFRPIQLVSGLGLDSGANVGAKTGVQCGYQRACGAVL